MSKYTQFKRPNVPIVRLSEKDYAKIMFWMKEAAPKECSGLGWATYNSEDNAWEIQGVRLASQKNTSSTTELDAEALGKLEIEHINAVRNGERQGELTWWWHSHVNMGVFWSATDLEAIAQLGEHGKFVSTVFNLKGEMLSSFYQNIPHSCFLPEIPTEISKEERLSLSFDSIVEAAKEIGYVLSDKTLQSTLEKQFAAAFTKASLENEKAEWKKEWDEVCPPVLAPTYSPPSKKNKAWMLGSWSDYSGSWEEDEYADEVRGSLIPLTEPSEWSIEDIVNEIYAMRISFKGITIPEFHALFPEIALSKLKEAIASDPYLRKVYVLHLEDMSPKDVPSLNKKRKGAIND